MRFLVDTTQVRSERWMVEASSEAEALAQVQLYATTRDGPVPEGLERVAVVQRTEIDGVVRYTQANAFGLVGST